MDETNNWKDDELVWRIFCLARNACGWENTMTHSGGTVYHTAP